MAVSVATRRMTPLCAPAVWRLLLNSWPTRARVHASGGTLVYLGAAELALRWVTQMFEVVGASVPFCWCSWRGGVGAGLDGRHRWRGVEGPSGRRRDVRVVGGPSSDAPRRARHISSEHQRHARSRVVQYVERIRLTFDAMQSHLKLPDTAKDTVDDRDVSAEG